MNIRQLASGRAVAPATPSFMPIGGRLLQRQCACGGGGSSDECDKKLQPRAAHASAKTETGSLVPPIVHEVLRSPGAPLDHETRAFFEPRFGHDFSRVRLHTDARAADSAQAVNALAYTFGQNVVFGAGRYAPQSPAGQRLLAHELTHVLQQSLSEPTKFPSEICPAEEHSELEAEAMALALTRESHLDASVTGGRALLQRRVADGEQDPIHRPLIEDFRRRHALPTGGVDESGNRVGPSDAEIKYNLLTAERQTPPCPDVELVDEEHLDDPRVRKAFKDANCISSESQAMQPTCQFTANQRRLLASAQQTAASRVQHALDRIGVGSSGQQFATDLAGQLFTNDPPSVAETIRRLRPIRDFLAGSTVQIVGRTCGDATCQKPATLAYVDGPGQLPIYICPAAFSLPESLHRTILHESLHWSGLDADPATPEGYCEKFDCLTPCLTKEDADAWTHYLDCLGKPLEFRRSFRREILESIREVP